MVVWKKFGADPHLLLRKENGDPRWSISQSHDHRQKHNLNACNYSAIGGQNHITDNFCQIKTKTYTDKKRRVVVRKKYGISKAISAYDPTFFSPQIGPYLTNLTHFYRISSKEKASGGLMARTNIEDCWWTDPRRSLLVKKIGSEELADGIVIKAWRLAQEFWKSGKGLVPKDLFETLPHFQALIDSKLADVRGTFVYVRGSSAYLDWIREKREQAKEAGKKSAEIRKSKTGSAQPEGGKGSKTPKISEREPNENRTDVNGTEPSDSYSFSDSGSSSDFNKNPTGSIKKPAKAEAPAKQSLKTNDCIALYCRLWTDKYTGSKCDVLGKDAGIVKRIVGALGAPRTFTLLTAYFVIPNPWYAEKRHDLSTFEIDIKKIGHFADTGSYVNRRVVREAEEKQHYEVKYQPTPEEQAEISSILNQGNERSLIASGDK